MQFQNKVIIITGGSLGIGFTTAKLFAEAGAKVAITGRNPEALLAAKKQIKGEVLCITSDVGKVSDIEELYQEVTKHYGPIDSIFANAGVARNGPLSEMTEADFDLMMHINFKGVYFTVQKALPHLNKGASIILNASIAGVSGFANIAAYAATKAAVIQMAKSFAADLAPQNIRVNSVAPGYIKTPIWGELDEASEKYKNLCASVPFGQRFGRPEEIAQVVLFLASDAASYITGQNLVIDGGLADLKLQSQKNND